MAYKTPEFKPGTKVCFCAVDIGHGRATTLKDYNSSVSFNEKDGKYYDLRDNLIRINGYIGVIHGLYWDVENEYWVYDVSVAIFSKGKENSIIQVPEALLVLDTDIMPQYPIEKYRDYIWEEEDRIIEKIKAKYEQEIAKVKKIYETFRNTLKGEDKI